MRFTKLHFALAVVLAMPGVAHAQTSATSSTTASIRVVQPITISKTTDLTFGTAVKPANANSNVVKIDETTGARTISGTGDGAILNTTTYSRAAYTVNGEGAQTFSISVNPTVTLTGSPSGSLTVTLTPSATTGTLSGTIGSAGSATFGVGGTVTLASSTSSGNYTGSFNAVVTYN